MFDKITHTDKDGKKTVKRYLTRKRRDDAFVKMVTDQADNAKDGETMEMWVNGELVRDMVKTDESWKDNA